MFLFFHAPVVIVIDVFFFLHCCLLENRFCLALQKYHLINMFSVHYVRWKTYENVDNSFNKYVKAGDDNSLSSC